MFQRHPLLHFSGRSRGTSIIPVSNLNSMSEQTQITTPKTPKASPLVMLGARLSIDPTRLLDTLKATAFSSARNEEEIIALVIVANTYGLNPILKELYAFPAKGGGIVPVVSVDGWSRMVNDHPQMDGLKFDEHHDANGELVSCTCSIYRKDRQHPTVVTEYYEECKRGTEPWKMKHRMLRHKALKECARVAFGFSGITDEEEAAETPTIGAKDVTPSKPVAKPLFTKKAEEPAPIVEAAPIRAGEKVIESLLSQSGKQWSDVAQNLLDQGMLDDVRKILAECSDEEINRVIEVLPKVLENMTGGGM